MQQHNPAKGHRCGVSNRLRNQRDPVLIIPVVGDFERMDDKKVEAHFREGKNDPNKFALIALAMGVLAFIFSMLR
jgi:hypothetical protein